MGNQVTGAETGAVVFEHTGGYGTALPGSPNGHKMCIVSESIARSRSLIKSNALCGSSRLERKPKKGKTSVAGNIVAEFAPEDNAHMLKHLFGAVATTGVGPYVHTFTVAALTDGFAFEKDFGANAPTGQRYQTAVGLRIDSMALNIPDEGAVIATYNVIGQDFLALTDTPLDAAPTAYGTDGFSFLEAEILENGATAASITTLGDITLSNNLDAGKGFVAGGGGVRKKLPGAKFSAGTSITAMFDDATLYQKIYDGAESTLKMTFVRGLGDGTAGNEKFELFFDHILFSENSVAIEGPGGLEVTADIMAFMDTANTDVRAVLTNAIDYSF